MKVLATAVALVFVSLYPAGAATAADDRAARSMSACEADVAKLCPGTRPGDGSVKACMKERKDKLSTECKKELAAARKAKKSG